MDSKILRNVNLFSELNDKELEKVSELSSLKKFSKGEVIFFDTEPYLGFYIVIEGSIKIFKIVGDGREQIIHFVYPYNTFAEVPLFEQHEKIKNDQFTYPANAMAIENDTKLILVRSNAFYDLLHKNNEIALKMLGALSKRLRYLNNYIESRMKDIPHRLAEFIIQEYKKSGKAETNRIEIEITKHDLASYLGTIDETLSRAFKKFQDEDIIEMRGRNIIIKNLKKLAVIAAE
ncbi:MAG: Crp/Fnr family transcriptional regulator [Ignavibacteria bacterium]|jgi:CRP-like cAMP-binding protein|nr:Crp/Fnr family transcriptional regulator [Ignavibacteria bacterium]MBK6875764.1 Crp/Fnr family transcriptional regulator [Ignavibacteria bacterium]MBK9226091.1 Crp/Fnr family transcriptional regulator [Ignavibacteria bacterium]